jgi:hypothetical protein
VAKKVKKGRTGSADIGVNKAAGAKPRIAWSGGGGGATTTKSGTTKGDTASVEGRRAEDWVGD